MTSFKDIAYQILKQAGKPLHSKEITRIAPKKGLLKTSGKTPEATMGAVLYTDVKRNGNKSRFIKTGPSIFGLNPEYKDQRRIVKNKKKPAKPLSEEFVKNAIIIYLTNNGWKVKTLAESRSHGVDIKAQKGNRYFSIETKGGKSHENNFINALGQIITRMQVVKAKHAYLYGIGLPKQSASIAVRRIPWQFAKKVCLHIFSVDRNKKVIDYSWQDMKKRQEK